MLKLHISSPLLKEARLEYFTDADGLWRFRVIDPKTDDNLFGSHGGKQDKQDVVDLVTAIFCQQWGPSDAVL